MALIAVVVKVSSRGPVLFKQERVSFDGTPFRIIKFRTMVTDAEAQGPGWTTPGDGRVTLVGRILRSTSLDELPQLFNVLRGDMSLVGPRPERPVFIQEFRQRIPRYMLRHKVPAGITGWAQVNGWRGDTSIDKRIEHDLYYLENWSVLLDLKIMLLTLLNGFRNRNAY
jgi:lipopolysaccharide/colanic/teichoic acid biosynthesis glycosyltransferase